MKRLLLFAQHLIKKYTSNLKTSHQVFILTRPNDTTEYGPLKLLGLPQFNVIADILKTGSLGPIYKSSGGSDYIEAKNVDQQFFSIFFYELQTWNISMQFLDSYVKKIEDIFYVI